MKHANIKLAFVLLFLLGIAFLPACQKDPGSDLPEETLMLNHWIWDGMNDAYLWEAYIPDLDPDAEPDPEQFFYDLLYKDDRESWITDDYESLAALFDGVQMATGMSAYPMLYTGTQVVFFVEYVTPGTPAADSGIARGDIIYTIDGNIPTTSNYYDLYYQNTATFGFADWNGSAMVPNGTEITLEATMLNQNPVVHQEVIEYLGHKIGYFVYTQFTPGKTGEWLDELNSVFDSFKSAGVDQVVVDVRYNPGGSLDLSSYIASTLAPVSVMQENDIFLDLVWNDFYNQYWADADLDDDGKADGVESTQLRIRLPESERNLDLPTVYFLTTDRTASAPESLMSGLYPYMNVVQIGTTTHGKCYASVTITDWEQPKRHNWAMQPIVIKYSNAEGFTDFVDGIDPDYEVQDNLLYAEPFGSLQDPLLAKALELITGTSPLTRKSVAAEPGFKPMPVPRKPLEEWHVELPRIR
jgi:carboxyl-terminal processing protease